MCIWGTQKDTHKEELEDEDLLVCLPPAPGHRCPSEPAWVFSPFLTEVWFYRQQHTWQKPASCSLRQVRARPYILVSFTAKQHHTVENEMGSIDRNGHLVALVPLASFCASWLEEIRERFQHPGCTGTTRWKKTEFPRCYLLDGHLKM